MDHVGHTCQEDVVTCSAVFVGYAGQKGMGREAPNVLCAMRIEARTSVGILQQGKQLRSQWP